MSNNMTTSIIVSVTKDQKKMLKKIAAQQNLKDLESTVTISSLGRQAIEAFIDRNNNYLDNNNNFKNIK